MAFASLDASVGVLAGDVAVLRQAVDVLARSAARGTHTGGSLAHRRVATLSTEEELSAVCAAQAKVAAARAAGLKRLVEEAIDSEAAEKDGAEKERRAVAGEVAGEVQERVKAVNKESAGRVAAAERDKSKWQGGIEALDRKIAAVKTALRDAHVASLDAQADGFGDMTEADMTAAEAGAQNSAAAAARELADAEAALGEMESRLDELENEADGLDQTLPRSAAPGSSHAPSTPVARKRARTANDGADERPAEDIEASIARLTAKRDVLKAAVARSPAKPTPTDVFGDLAEQREIVTAAKADADRRLADATASLSRVFEQLDALMREISSSKHAGSTAAKLLRSLCVSGGSIPQDEGRELAMPLVAGYDTAVAGLQEAGIVDVDDDVLVLV